MKNKKVIILLLSVSGVILPQILTAQNLDSLPQAKRDSILIAIAKETVLKYGPGYYQDCKEPVISRTISSKERKEVEAVEGKTEGRIIYHVVFLHDETKVQFETGYAATVRIWADTGKPWCVYFGNNLGILISAIPNGEVLQIDYQPMDKAILEERRKVNELLMHPIERRDNFDSLRVIPKGDTIRK